MIRSVQPEILDQLPAEDPRALQSRRDLRRINALMGNADIIANFIRPAQPVTIVELGAGDGNIAASVAQRLKRSCKIILVDQNPTGGPSLARFDVQIVRANVFDWLPKAPRCDVIIANLFLHHFEAKELREMFALAAERCRVFAAAEPRRNSFALAFSRCVGLIGCNSVTRHDAVVSVRAGFNGRELSSLWPARGDWRLTEKPARLFTHFFGAAR